MALAQSHGAAAELPTRSEIEALAAAILAQPLPRATPGEVAVVDAAGERDLDRGFLADLQSLPGWSGAALVLRAGSLALPAVAAAANRPDLLACAARTCTLRAPLLVERGAALVVADLELRLEQEAGALISAQGDLFVSDAVLLGWNARRDAPAATDAQGYLFRPWITGLETNRTVIRRSRLAHLGYLSNSTQGLAFTDANREPRAGRPAADIVGNRIEDLYFGFFTWEAEGIRLLANEIAGSHVYGIDPHDATRDMLIALNSVTGTRDSHGVVLSRRIHDTVVAYNRSAGNGGAGFFVDKGSWNVTFAQNEAVENGTDGITVYESRDIRVLGNVVARNGRAGIRVRASADVAVEENLVADNAGPGVFVYDWSHAARPPDEEDRLHMQPARATIRGNRLAGNRGACALRGAVTILPAGGNDCP